MSVIIHGLDMPLSKTELIVFPSGVVQVYDSRENYLGKAQAVPLPEGHGRLVDAREVLEKADKAPWFDGDVSELGLLLGSEVTTIIPAEGGTDDGQTDVQR